MKQQSLKIRYAKPDDGEHLKAWFAEPGIAEEMNLSTNNEVDSQVGSWMNQGLVKAGLVATVGGVPCGMAVLYLTKQDKIVHQCKLGILVSGEYRGRGIGRQLLLRLIDLAKDKFNIEVLCLDVLEVSPARKLYQSLGFRKYCKYSRMIKLNGKYKAMLSMARPLTKTSPGK